MVFEEFSNCSDVAQNLIGFIVKFTGSTRWAWPERKRWNHGSHGNNSYFLTSLYMCVLVLLLIHIRDQSETSHQEIILYLISVYIFSFLDV